MGTIKFSLLGKGSFLISLLLGTFLLGVFWISNADWVVVLGFYYVIVAAVINMLILLHELIEYLNDVSGKKDSGNSVLLLLVNIPLALLYLFIFFVIAGY